jgi:hypothetical protein
MVTKRKIYSEFFYVVQSHMVNLHNLGVTEMQFHGTL